MGAVHQNQLSETPPQKAAIDLDKLLRSDNIWIQPLKTRISELDVYESACNEGAGYMTLAGIEPFNSESTD
uniref:hypothetical protein n=1 Tax=Escherichia coli TaxID=562 RepID=UPI00202CFA25|nr:hypothetical protein [Escherichia coli]